MLTIKKICNENLLVVISIHEFFLQHSEYFLFFAVLALVLR